MDTNQQEIYLLLKDIYNYLNRNIGEIAFSTEDRKVAEELIHRSKKKLQNIALAKDNLTNISTLKLEKELCVSPSNSTVDDHPPSLLRKELPTLQVKTSTSKTICPFKTQSAKELPNGIKRGTLSMRRKVFKIDRLSKVFAAVNESWLLLYTSGKSPKPFCTLDLEMYEAQEDLNITGNRNSKKHSTMQSSFAVFSSIFPDKNYSFVAITHKDMLHWVAHINESHERSMMIKSKVFEHNYEDLKYIEVTDQEGIYTEINNKPVPTYEDLDQRLDTPPKLPAKSILIQPSKIKLSDEKLMDIITIYSKANSDSSELSKEDGEQSYDDIAVLCDEVKDLNQRATSNLVNFPQSNINIKPFAIDDHENIQAILEKPTVQNKQFDVIENVVEPDETYTDIVSINCEVVGWNMREFGLGNINNSFQFTSSHLPKNKTGSLKYDMPTASSDEMEALKFVAEPNKNQFNKAWNNLKRTAQNRYLKSKIPVKHKGCSKEIDTDPNTTDISFITENVHTPSQTSNIVKIIRQKFVQKEYPTCSLETFSRSSKLETFQANPTTECTEENKLKYFRTAATETNDLDEISCTANTHAQRTQKNDQPMILFKDGIRDGSISKKSPVVSVKPKNVIRKFIFYK